MKRIFLFAGVQPVRNYLLLKSAVVCLIALLTACGDDDHKSSAVFNEALGTYEVSDQFEADDQPQIYEVSMAGVSAGEPYITISNFGDMMHAPLHATLSGNAFTIPSQTFVGKSMTITITGAGTRTDDQLDFTYMIDTGNSRLIHVCKAGKK